MPLDARDKLTVEMIEEMSKVTTAQVEDQRVRERLIHSAGQLARAILEAVPPDFPLRDKIIERLADSIQLLATATAKAVG
jgi:hypothetical protein